MPNATNSWAGNCFHLSMAVMVSSFLGGHAGLPGNLFIGRAPRRLDRLRPRTRSGNGNSLDLSLGHVAHDVDMEQPVIQHRAGYLDALRQHEGALKLARRDTAMEK